MLSAPPVELRDVAVALAGRPVLRHVDVRVEAGELIAVMGANGSGKSTLVRTMLGLWPVTGGSALLFGTPVPEFRDWRRVGFVPQRTGAASGVPASVAEVVASGRLSRRRPFAPRSRADRAAVARALADVGLADRARDAIATLSGGQQQRVLIARALAGEPDLIVLDEPTAGVDLPHQQALAESLSTLAGRGATVVLVAHELGPLASLVDRAVVMRDGRVAYDGAPLTDHQVHEPRFGDLGVPHAEGHSHHHGRPSRHDHAPHVDSPLDRPLGHREDLR